MAVTLKANNPQDSIKILDTSNGQLFYINTKEYSCIEIEDILYSNKFSKDIIKAAENKKTWGYIFGSLGFIGTGICIYEIQRLDNNYGRITLDTRMYEMIGLTLISFVSSIILFTDSNHTFYEAIEEYNKNLLNSSTSSNFGFHINFESNKLVFNYTL
jgi:hypothetical protein